MILFSFGDLIGYLSTPRYFLASLSICSSAPSLVCSIVYPFNGYHVIWIVMIDNESATLGSLDTFLCLILPSAVLKRIRLSSKSIHVGVTCGDPSDINVDMNAKFLSNRSLCRKMTGVVGRFAEVSVAIPASGVGQITLSSGGERTEHIARSADGRAVARGRRSSSGSSEGNR